MMVAIIFFYQSLWERDTTGKEALSSWGHTSEGFLEFSKAVFSLLMSSRETRHLPLRG